MSLLAWLKDKLPTPMAREKEELVHRIEEETQRLKGAVNELTREVRVVKKERMEMTKVFDEALEAISKEYRK